MASESGTTAYLRVSACGFTDAIYLAVLRYDYCLSNPSHSQYTLPTHTVLHLNIGVRMPFNQDILYTLNGCPTSIQERGVMGFG